MFCLLLDKQHPNNNSCFSVITTGGSCVNDLFCVADEDWPACNGTSVLWMAYRSSCVKRSIFISLTCPWVGVGVVRSQWELVLGL